MSNKEFFREFSNAAIEVLTTMAGVETIVGEESVSHSHDKTWGDVTGLIGLPGDKSNGFMSISFEKDCILDIVSSMIGEDYKEINSAVSDAVGELTNMISSVARAKLTKIGLELGMALPFTVIGKGVGVDTALTGEGHCTILKTKSGNFQLAVVLADSRSK